MTMVQAKDLRPGDMFDLEGCPYVSDPAGRFEYEYATVIEIERETPDCVLIGYDGGAFGVPPDYEFYVENAHD
jgi:hypothetical protein